MSGFRWDWLSSQHASSLLWPTRGCGNWCQREAAQGDSACARRVRRHKPRDIPAAAGEGSTTVQFTLRLFIRLHQARPSSPVVSLYWPVSTVVVKRSALHQRQQTRRSQPTKVTALAWLQGAPEQAGAQAAQERPAWRHGGGGTSGRLCRRDRPPGAGEVLVTLCDGPISRHQRTKPSRPCFRPVPGSVGPGIASVSARLASGCALVSTAGLSEP